MDTPQKSKNNPIAASVKRLEDSPVLNFMNSLSPIKPVKSVHITQMINPLTLASLQSLFTFPIKECQFNQRHQLSDQSRPEFSTDDWNTNNKNKQNVDADNKLLHDDREENYDPMPSTNRGVSNVTSYKDGSELMESNEKLSMNGGSSITNTCGNMDYQDLSGSYAAVRKHCLVFDKARIQHLANSSTSNPHIPDNDSSLSILPGIGLHLNTLPRTPNAYNISNNDSSFSGNILIGLSPFSSLHQKPLGTTLTGYSLEKEFDGVSRVENEETNLSSPRKRRRRLEQTGDGDGSCKNCSCKKSKCLKLYCECFAAGVYCMEPCMCIDCFNKPIHEGLVLSTRKQIESRNPLAFAPKVISSSEVGDELSQTPASGRHKQGCNCKKSGCLKKYCECYQGGVGCSINCRCEGCKNTFGTKDGSCALHVDHELAKDETNTIEKAELNRSFLKTTIQENLDQAMVCELTETPLKNERQSTHSFSKKRPSTPFESSSSFTAGQGFGKSSFFQPTPKYSHHPETIGEYEMPEFLLEGSPNSGPQSFSSKKRPSSVPCSSFPAGQGFGKSSCFQLPPKYSHLPETIREDEMPEFLLEGSPNSGLQSTSSPNGKRILSPSPNGKRVLPPQKLSREDFWS